MREQQDTFACASGYDETKQRYLGLEAGKLVSVSPSGGLCMANSKMREHSLGVSRTC
jgi:hypothetical protein